VLISSSAAGSFYNVRDLNGKSDSFYEYCKNLDIYVREYLKQYLNKPYYIKKTYSIITKKKFAISKIS